MSAETVFSPRLLTGWVAAALLTFAASLYFMSRSDDRQAVDEAGANTVSHSAVGHAGVAELLHRLGIPVVKSRYGSPEKLGRGSLLVIAEPRYSPAAAELLPALLGAKTVLLVLPKWQTTPSEDHAGWIDEAEPIATGEADWVLGLALRSGHVVRVPDAAGWTTDRIGAAPALTTPAQLVQSTRLKPIVANGDGILVGEIKTARRRLWVLSDPDIIENHGLGQGSNAAFAVALIEGLRGTAGSVIFDETVHGFAARPANPFNLLIAWPFVLVTAQAAAAVLLLIWATMARFGAPEPESRRLEAGKAGLVESAAALLELGGHQAVIVRRYVQAVLRDAARQLHAPRGLAEDQLVLWLQRVGTARAVAVDCRILYERAMAIPDRRRAQPAALLPIARDIHKWKHEIIDGPSGNPRHR